MTAKIVRKASGLDVELRERLKEFRESLGLEQKQLAELTGTAFRTYQDYELGNSPPKIGFVRKLAELGCDPTWFLTGLTHGAQEPLATHVPDVERLSFRASAGNGRTILEATGKKVAVRAEVLQRLNLRPDYARYVEADGDSMAPTICHGDPMIIDVSPEARGRIRDGSIYVFTIGDEAYVKRLRREPGAIIMMSDNKEAFPERTVPPGEIFCIVGRVRWGEREL
ncbi:XRE family transcriptional regulator [Ancylobacter sp. G4_0304]|uniref:XRE family transcriptional regulator n=1 Tax=Ancylobacter sp. G4_0304 TaxID=3114289 RepID=UPI0039C6CBCD